MMSCLHGDEKDTLKGFDLTDAQYEVAVKHLKLRYDDKKYIIQSQYTSLSNLMKSTNATKELQKTFNLIETQLRSLESMGEQIEDNYVISIIKSKLPNSFNLKLEESIIREWTADSLRKSINKLLLVRERSEYSFDYSADNLDHTDLVQYEYSGEGLLCHDVKIKCMYCDKGHWSDECQKYKTLFEIKYQLK